MTAVDEAQHEPTCAAISACCPSLQDFATAMLDGFADKGVYGSVRLSMGRMDQDRARFGRREKTKYTLLDSSKSRPVCLALCAHPPTDSRREVVERTALQVVGTVARGRRRAANLKIATSLAREGVPCMAVLGGNRKEERANDRERTQVSLWIRVAWGHGSKLTRGRSTQWD